MTIREKVARASDATADGRPVPGELYQYLATAAITAFLEAAAEEGWQRLNELVDRSSCPECGAFNEDPYSTETFE